LSDTALKTRNGAIVYDTAIINQISDAMFSADGWATAEPVTGPLRSAGRGNTMIVGDGRHEYVLRHYMRGGLPGRIVKDTYIWAGERQTRSFAEWYLLAKLCALGLPVPRPAAARYVRRGPIYTADLLTLRIPAIRSLAERITESSGDANFWRKTGAQMQRFHSAGVFHADLNAYNLQLGQSDKLFLLDFDRGRIRSPGHWQQKNIARLHRSLRKIKQLNRELHFNANNWNEFLDGYFKASRLA
jgi:3-deoxy-D-manno-octulosonic acid kinase